MTRLISTIILVFVLVACSDGPVNNTMEHSERGVQIQTNSDITSASTTSSLVEVVTVDARFVGIPGGPALSTAILETGVEYRITVDGNWSAWPPDWWKCTSLYPTKYISPSVPGGTSAGFDAEWRITNPNNCEIALSRTNGIEFSLDAGANFFNPTPLDGTFNSDHIYVYEVTGAGQKAAFFIPDTNEDNHGILKVTIEEVVTDDTPPIIEVTVSGTQGNNGWYTSDVSVAWTVIDNESDISSSEGCEDSEVTEDTEGITFTCSATSAGGTASDSVTIKRDATNPLITFSGNENNYTVDQTVDISCSASDEMSGIANSDCPGASGDAYTFGLGTTTLNASATDNAGNGSTALTEFNVSVTSGSLCSLVREWVSQRGVANALCQQLNNGAIRGFQNTVRAQSGRHIPAEYASILLTLSDGL